MTDSSSPHVAFLTKIFTHFPLCIPQLVSVFPCDLSHLFTDLLQKGGTQCSSHVPARAWQGIPQWWGYHQDHKGVNTGDGQCCPEGGHVSMASTSCGLIQNQWFIHQLQYIALHCNLNAWTGWALYDHNFVSWRHPSRRPLFILGLTLTHCALCWVWSAHQRLCYDTW